MPTRANIPLTKSQWISYPFDRQLRRSYRAFRILPAITYENVLDIGAHQGSFTDSVLTLFAPKRVWLVEADPQLAEALQRRYAEDSRCRVVHCAVSDKSGTAQMRINKHRASSSLLPMSQRTPGIFGADMAEVEVVSVPALSLDDLFAREKIERVNFCKVDIQGAERMLIAGGRNALRSVRWLYMEVLFDEFYENCAQFAELDALLKDCGFKLNLLHDFRRTVDGDVAYANALYRNLSEEKSLR